MTKLVFLILMMFTVSLLPDNAMIPVQNASANDWNKKSFWFHPWGKSGVHKGIDIFAKKGTPTLASTYGIVIYNGQLKRGGNVVAILGPKCRIHYYAHLKNIDVTHFEWIDQGEKIGRVGDTGNAAGKPPHLHYSVLSLIPNLANFRFAPQAWKRLFYVDPSTQFVSLKNKLDQNRAG